MNQEALHRFLALVRKTRFVHYLDPIGITAEEAFDQRLRWAARSQDDPAHAEEAAFLLEHAHDLRRLLRNEADEDVEWSDFFNTGGGTPGPTWMRRDDLDTTEIPDGEPLTDPDERVALTTLSDLTPPPMAARDQQRLMEDVREGGLSYTGPPGPYLTRIEDLTPTPMDQEEIAEAIAEAAAERLRVHGDEVTDELPPNVAQTTTPPPLTPTPPALEPTPSLGVRVAEPETTDATAEPSPPPSAAPPSRGMPLAARLGVAATLVAAILLFLLWPVGQPEPASGVARTEPTEARRAPERRNASVAAVPRPEPEAPDPPPAPATAAPEAPAPAPVVAAPAPEVPRGPAPGVPDLTGGWQGSAGEAPFRLTVDRQRGYTLAATAAIDDAHTLSIAGRWSEGAFVLRATSGGLFTGSLRPTDGNGTFILPDSDPVAWQIAR